MGGGWWGITKIKPTQLGLQLSFATSWGFAKNSRNKLSQGGQVAGWVGGRLEKVEIKPSQPAGAGAGLSLAINFSRWVGGGWLEKLK